MDDFWGTPAWERWSDAMRQVFPEFTIVDIPYEHPIRHMMFSIEGCRRSPTSATGDGPVAPANLALRISVS